MELIKLTLHLSDTFYFAKDCFFLFYWPHWSLLWHPACLDDSHIYVWTLLSCREMALFSCWYVKNTVLVEWGRSRATPGISLPCKHISVLLWAFSPNLQLYHLEIPSVINAHPLFSQTPLNGRTPAGLKLRHGSPLRSYHFFWSLSSGSYSFPQLHLG